MISLIEICVIVLILYTTLLLLSIYQRLLSFCPLDLTIRFVYVLSITLYAYAGSEDNEEFYNKIGQYETDVNILNAIKLIDQSV